MDRSITSDSCDVWWCSDRTFREGRILNPVMRSPILLGRPDEQATHDAQGRVNGLMQADHLLHQIASCLPIAQPAVVLLQDKIWEESENQNKATSDITRSI